MNEGNSIIRRQEPNCAEDLLNFEKISEGEVMILKLVQDNAFAADIVTMRKNSHIINCQQDETLQNKNLQHVKPFIDEKGLVGVDG